MLSELLLLNTADFQKVNEVNRGKARQGGLEGEDISSKYI
jgi:hypothetical protein